MSFGEEEVSPSCTLLCVIVFLLLNAEEQEDHDVESSLNSAFLLQEEEGPSV